MGAAWRSEKSEQLCDESEASDAFALASPSLLEESVCTKTNPFNGKCDLLSGSDTRKECGAASGISEQYEEQYRLAGMGIALQTERRIRLHRKATDVPSDP